MTVETLAPVTYQNIGVVTGFLLVPRGSGVVNIYNGDITNVLLVSPSSSPSLSNSVPIQPLTNATIDGSRAMYGSAQAGTLAQVVVSASAQISPSPAQIAAQIGALGLATATNQVAGTAAINNPAYGPSTSAGQTSQTAAINNPAYGPSTLSRQITQETNIPTNISTTGVPLLNLGTQILNAAVTTINAGTSTTFPAAGTLSFNQPGMEVILQIESSAATAFCKVQFNWLDAGGNSLSQDAYWIYPGTTGNIHALYASGPTDGLQLTITISAVTGLVKVDKLLVYSTSKIYSRWQFQSTSMPALANGAAGLAIIEPSANIVGHRVPAVIAGSGSDTTTLGMFVGKVWLYANTSSNINDMTVKINDIADQNPAGGDNYVTIKTDGAGNINTYIQMPRIQSALTMNNLNAAAQTLRYMLVNAEY